MIKKEDIKTYNSKEELETDYENFKQHWQYDREREAGVHDSGIGFSKVFLGGGVKIKYNGLPEWTHEAIESGLSQEEADQYLRMLKNQFVTLNEKEPYVEPERSIEEVLADWEENDQWTVDMARKHHHLSEEELKKMAEDLKKHREWYIYESGHYGKRSDR